MKPVAEWDEAYLMSLPVGEFDWLETKGRRSLDLTIPTVSESAVLETISKEVSAFANSGGGTLVYGLADPKPGETEWHVDDGGVSVSVKKNGTKEWMETIIPNQMDPPLEKFNVYAVPPSGPDTKIMAGRALFIIEVPDSQFAPHQASDYRYYARVASRARPIGHRLVTDIMSRRQHPKIDMSFRLEVDRVQVYDSNFTGSQTPRYAKTLKLKIIAHNSGRVYAQHVHVIVNVPVEDLPHKPKVALSVEVARRACVGLAFENTHRDVMETGPSPYYTPKYGPSRPRPLLPRLNHTWEIDLNPRILDTMSFLDHAFSWEVYADNSNAVQGEGLLRDAEMIDKQHEAADGE